MCTDGLVSCLHKAAITNYHSSEAQKSTFTFTQFWMSGVYHQFHCVYVCVYSVMSNSLRLHGLQHPLSWDSPGKNNGVHATSSSRGSSGSRDRTLTSFVARTGRQMGSLPLVPPEPKSNCWQGGSV